MVPMHDQTRRQLMTALFWLLGVAPTLLILGMAVSRLVLSEERTLARQLTQTLGCPVEIDRVRYPRPGVMQLYGTTLLDPVTGVPIATCPTLTVTSHDGRDSGVEISGDLLRINESRIGSATQLIRRALDQQPPSKKSGQVNTLAFERLEIRDLSESETPAAYTADHLLCRLRSSRSESGIQVRFNPESQHPQESSLAAQASATASVGQQDQSAQPDQLPSVQFSYRREMSGESLVHQIELNTGRTPLPCDLLTAWFGGFELVGNIPPLGSDTTFSGKIEAKHDTSGWSGQCECWLADMAVAHQLPNLPELSFASADGKMELYAVFSKNRIIQAEGWVELLGGQVGIGLMDSWARSLNAEMQTVDPLRANNRGDALRFQRLLVYYHVKDDLLAIKPSESSRTILIGDGLFVRMRESLAVNPIRSLISDLVPRSRAGLELSPFSAPLIRCCFDDCDRNLATISQRAVSTNVPAEGNVNRPYAAVPASQPVPVSSNMPPVTNVPAGMNANASSTARSVSGSPYDRL